MKVICVTRFVTPKQLKQTKLLNFQLIKTFFKYIFMHIKSVSGHRHNSTALTFYICSFLHCSWGFTSPARAWPPEQQGWELTLEYEEEELIRHVKPTLGLHFIFPGCLCSLVNFRDKRKIPSQSCQHWGTWGWDFITWTPWKWRLLSWLGIIKYRVDNSICKRRNKRHLD